MRHHLVLMGAPLALAVWVLHDSRILLEDQDTLEFNTHKLILVSSASFASSAVKGLGFVLLRDSFRDDDRIAVRIEE